IAGAARIALAREQGRFITALDASKPIFSNSEITEWVEATPDILPAAELSAATQKRIGIYPAPWAYCLWRLTEIDADAAHQFADDLAEYRTTGVGDPRYALLNYLRGMQQERRRSYSAEFL